MFSAWDFNSWIGSFVVVVVMMSFITGFAWFVTQLVFWVWGGESDVATLPRMKGIAEEPPIRKAA